MPQVAPTQMTSELYTPLSNMVSYCFPEFSCLVMLQVELLQGCSMLELLECPKTKAHIALELHHTNHKQYLIHLAFLKASSCHATG